MAAARPFASAAVMAGQGDEVWQSLEPPDWLEAFAAHPKIGAGGVSGEGTARWSQGEQAGVAAASDATRRRLTEANREYEARFGYIFIVRATGRTAGEMLALLERRLRHDADDELRIAAEEQRQITRLRLEKMLAEEPDTTP